MRNGFGVLRRTAIGLVTVWLVSGCGAEGRNIAPYTGDGWSIDDSDGVDEVSGDLGEPDMGPPFGGVQGWKVLNVRKPNTSWTDLSGADLGNGAYQVFAVGQLGEVVIYDSRSDSWEDASLTSKVPLSGVWGVSDEFLVIVGDKGLLRRYSDDLNAGQSSWKADDFGLGLTADMKAVHGLSKNLVWAVGAKGTVMIWDGSSWNAFAGGIAPQPATAPTFNGVYVLSENDALVSADGALYRLMGGVLAQYTLPKLAGASMSAILVDGNNRAWVGADMGKTFHIDLSTQANDTNSPTSYSNVRSFCLLPTGQLFAGGDNLPLMLWELPDVSSPGTAWTPHPIESPDFIDEKYPGRITDQARIVGIWGTSADNMYVATREKKILHYAVHE